jgi:E3 ubiquitin-protein ligase RGLG
MIQLIPVFGFGDITTKGTSVFPFFPDGRPCNGFQEVLSRYSEIAPQVVLSGPSKMNFFFFAF